MHIWTEEKVKDLRFYWPLYSASEIARRLGGGVTRNAVIGKAHRLGIGKPARKKVLKPRRPSVPNPHL